MADTKISALTSATTPVAGTEVLPIVQSGTTKKVAIADLTAGRDVAVKNLGVNVAQSVWSSGNAVEVYGPGNGVWSNSNGNTRLVCNWYYNGGSKFGAAGLGASMYMLDSNTHYWYSSTAAGASAGDPITSVNTMQLASTGNLTLLTGNLIQGTAAKGINFTANTAAAGMTSQLLNWYEEGTWTPTVASTGGGTPTYVRQIGRYTRIGNRVFFQIEIDLATKGTLAAGDVTLTGLPYTSNSTVANWSTVAPGICDGFTYPAGANQLVAVVTYNGTTVDPYWLKSGASTVNLKVADISATARISFSGHYMV